MNSSSDGESVLGNSKYGVGEIGRPNGVLHPPENAWLKDDARSRTGVLRRFKSSSVCLGVVWKK